MTLALPLAQWRPYPAPAPGRQGHSPAGSTSALPGSPCPPGRGRSRGKRAPRGLPPGRRRVSLQHRAVWGQEVRLHQQHPRRVTGSPPRLDPAACPSLYPSMCPIPDPLHAPHPGPSPRAPSQPWELRAGGCQQPTESCSVAMGTAQGWGLSWDRGGARGCAAVPYLLLGGCSGAGTPGGSTCARQGSWSRWCRVGAPGAGSA